MNNLLFEPQYILGQFCELYNETYIGDNYPCDDEKPINYAMRYRSTILESLKEGDTPRLNGDSLKDKIVQRILTMPFYQMGVIEGEPLFDQTEVFAENAPMNLPLDERFYLQACIFTLVDFYNSILSEGDFDFRISYSDFDIFLSNGDGIQIPFWF